MKFTHPYVDALSPENFMEAVIFASQGFLVHSAPHGVDRKPLAMGSGVD